MLAFHNTLYHQNSGLQLETSSSNPQQGSVNLNNFNEMLNLVNNGQSEQVAQKIVMDVNQLIPELEQKRLATKNHSKYGSTTQGSFTLNNGFEMSFIVTDNGSTVSYSPKESQSGDPRMPFGYITLEDGKFSSVNMWTPKSQQAIAGKYHRIGVKRTSESQFDLETQFTFNDGVADAKERLRSTQQILAANPNGELAQDVSNTLAGKPILTKNGARTIDDMHKLAI